MSNSFKNYEYVLDQEVLHEVACNVMADLSRYIESKGISIFDTKEDVVLLYWHMAEVKNDIVDERNNNDQKLNFIKGYLLFIKKYIELLGAERKPIEHKGQGLKDSL